MFRFNRIALIRMGVAVVTMSLGFFFIIVGILKLSPVLNESVYREMRKMFIRHARVFPLSDITGWMPNPHLFRKVVGITEVISGIIIVLIPGPIKECATIILLVVMCGDAHAHAALNEDIDRMMPAITIMTAFVGRFVFIVYLHWCDLSERAMRHAQHLCADASSSKPPDTCGDSKDQKPCQTEAASEGNNKKIH